MKKVLIIVAPTGAGKNFLYDSIHKYGYLNVPSYTTRDLRPKETAQEYIKIDEEAFEQMFQDCKLVEYLKYGEVVYGIGAVEFRNILDSLSSYPVLIIEPNGVLQVAKYLSLHSDIEVEIAFLDLPRIERFQNLVEGNIRDGQTGKEATINALDRIVRGGDNISNLFNELWPRIENLLVNFKLYKLSSRKDLNIFIEVFCSPEKEKYIFKRKIDGKN